MWRCWGLDFSLSVQQVVFSFAMVLFFIWNKKHTFSVRIPRRKHPKPPCVLKTKRKRDFHVFRFANTVFSNHTQSSVYFLGSECLNPKQTQKNTVWWFNETIRDGNLRGCELFLFYLSRCSYGQRIGLLTNKLCECTLKIRLWPSVS